MSAMAPALAFECKLDPLDGSRRVDLGGGVGDVYLVGCKFRLSLGNAGDRPITIDSMRVHVEAEDLLPVSFPERNRNYGAALRAHQLFIEVGRSRFSGWWMLADSSETRGERRTLSGASDELFVSPGAPRMRFAIEPGQSESIEGAILATEPGLYAVRLAAVATAPGSNPVARGTSAIRLCFAEPRQ